VASDINVWKAQSYRCLQCNWQGTGAECRQGEAHGTLVGLVCPRCADELFAVAPPSDAQTGLNWALPPDGGKRQARLLEKGLNEFAERSLLSLGELPDLPGADLVLVWDIEDAQRGGETFIRHGEHVIWREPARFESCERFIKVAHMLKARYGDRLQDLVPARRSRLWLYGDALDSPRRISDCRETLGTYAR